MYNSVNKNENIKIYHKPGDIFPRNYVSSSIKILFSEVLKETNMQKNIKQNSRLNFTMQG
jgi:hypothetical protein